MQSSQQQSSTQKQRPCSFCIHNKNDIDYKDTSGLRRYLSSYAKIVPRKRSGVCDWHQRKLALAVKRARLMALLPFTQR